VKALPAHPKLFCGVQFLGCLGTGCHIPVCCFHHVCCFISLRRLGARLPAGTRRLNKAVRDGRHQAGLLGEWAPWLASTQTS